jgi:uncharacterized protein (DUF427 family)
MKQPGPDHPITLTANPRRVRVRIGDLVLAETRAAVTLQEASYPPVQYIPRQDAVAERLVPSTKTTHCPYKGDASYLSIRGPDGVLTDAIWSYETPFPAVAEIAGHLAFYPNKVTIEELAD